MTTEPTIIDEDRAAAEEIGRRVTTPSTHTHFMATIIARHRGKREKRLVEALRYLARVAESSVDSVFRDRFGSDQPSIHEAVKTARQALKEYGQ